MAGIPPFNGFYSKELLFEAAYEVAHEGGGLAWLYPAVATVASVFTIVYSLKFLAVFVGERRAPVDAVHRPPVALVAPPAVPAAAAAVVSVSPQLAVDAIVQSAVDATATGDIHRLEVGLPTSVSPPVAMSAVAILGGVAAYPFTGRLAGLVGRGLDTTLPVRPSGWYEWTVTTAAATSARFGPLVHDGLLRTYVSWVAAAGSALALAGFAVVAGVPSLDALGVPVAVAVVLAVAVVAAVAVTAASSHVAGVLMLSILGFMLAIFFILASAPDLALTQLVVETLVLVLFLLVIDKLPAFYGAVGGLRGAADAAVAGVVGVTVFLTVVLATAPGPNDVIAEFFVDHAGVPAEHGDVLANAGGGGNIVNVILVDFRALDTLGEISVVGIAALSILALIARRGQGETE
jgi:multicomponent Na+:H+ antiporter subunit A